MKSIFIPVAIFSCVAGKNLEASHKEGEDPLPKLTVNIRSSEINSDSEDWVEINSSNSEETLKEKEAEVNLLKSALIKNQEMMERLKAGLNEAQMIATKSKEESEKAKESLDDTGILASKILKVIKLDYGCASGNPMRDFYERLIAFAAK